MTKFIPREINGNVNVSKDNPLHTFMKASIGLCAIIVFVFVVLLSISEVAIRFMPDHLNNALGKFFRKNIGTSDEFMAERDRIQTLLDNVLGETELRDQKFQLHILDDDTKNALAFPGNTIAITTGLLEELNYENELVMILGHEVAHYQHNDHLRSMSRGLILTGLFGLLQASGAGNTSRLISGASELYLGQYSRTQESRADEFGLSLLNRYYGHVNGAVSTFEHLRQAGEKWATLNGMLSTHPITDQRIKQLHGLIKANQYTLQGNEVLVPFVFQPGQTSIQEQSIDENNNDQESKPSDKLD